MSRLIDKLQPKVQAALNLALQEMKDTNVSHFVDSTFRTVEEQQAYYAQGRKPLADVNALRIIAGLNPIGNSDNTYTITNCDGIVNKSKHQSGLAVDIVPLDSKGNEYWPPVGNIAWKRISDVMVKYNFSWGGLWTKTKDGIDPDCPHYTYIG